VRNPRQKESPEMVEAFYHLTTRAVAGDFLFGDMDKEMLRKHLWLVAERCGINVLTYAVMTNHLHIVVHAPKRARLDDAELVRRYALLHSGSSRWEERQLEDIRAMLAADGVEAAIWRTRQMLIMGDISSYMKLLKQRYSIWYNRVHGRFGTLWAERFGSVQLEPGEVVRRIAAYVDVNPVRAHLCRDPKDYRFCGYAEAVAGSIRAQRGIMRALGIQSWDEAQKDYRMRIFVRAARRSKKGASVTAEEREQVLAKEGELTVAEQLRCRCRFFTHGAVLGSQAFVMERLRRFRTLTGRGERMQPQPGQGAAVGFMALHKVHFSPGAA
jgi:putative transposase